MRLREIRHILERMETRSAFLISEYVNSNATIIKNIRNFKELLTVSEALPFFDTEIKTIHKSAVFSTTQDFIQMTKENAEEVISNANYIVMASESLLRALYVVLPDQEKNSINIKLPCTDDLQSLIQSLTKFEQSISQVITNENINGKLNINNWDSGSFWVELFLGTQAAVMLISGIAWSAAVISKKRTEGKLIEEHVRSLGIKNDSLDDILDKQKQATALLLEKEARHLQVEHFDSNEDNEQFERLKMATKTFAELIQQGAEIHPALSAPEQAQNLFPNYKSLETIVSKIKMIGNAPQPNDEQPQEQPEEDATE